MTGEPAKGKSKIEVATTGGSAPGIPGWLSQALVSANYGNSVVVVGTPTGFTVIDLIRQTELLSGTTSTPVRGIAADPAQGVAYVTVPDSNSLITVPLPVQHTAAQATITISGTEKTVNGVSDTGTVWLQVAGASASASYAAGDTPTSVASKLAAAINSYGLGFPVSTSANGNIVTVAANRLGPAANQWPLATSCKSNFAGVACSFSATPSAATLSGGN